MMVTILIVDDNEDDQRLYRRALADFGCSLEMAGTAAAGFARLADATPDLILLDFNLPDMDGLSFMKRLAEQSATPIPIVMLTGQDRVEVAVEVMKHGANDYLVKDTEGRYLRLLPGVARRVMAAHEQRELAQRLQKEIQTRLRFSQTLMRNSMDGIHVADMQGNVVEANDAFCRMLGYTREEMARLNVADWVTEFSAEELRARFKDHIGRNAVLEAVHRRKDGSLINVEISISGMEIDGQNFIFGSSRDITERKAVLEALAKSGANMRAMMDNSPYLTWMKDAEGRYLKINKVFADYLRLDDPEQAVGKTDHDLQPTELAEKYRADDAEVMAARLQKHVEESAFDGIKVHWVETYKTPITDAHGNVLGTVGFARDITERKEAERALRDAMRQLEKRELAKTRFLAAAGHDLRQPLTAASLYIDTLRRTRPTQQQAEVIGCLGQAMDTFKMLLDALLNISKLDAGAITPEFTSIDVPGLMTWLEENYAPMAAEQQIGFKLYYPLKEALAVHSDIGLLRAVLMNLVSNAIKFTQHGGILVSARRRGGDVLFEVWDTGIGIPDEYVPLIFDEFYQINNPQRDRASGLGLGLSIAERALALLGGTIECRSRIGRGSVFGFRLPLGCAPGSGMQPHVPAASRDGADHGMLARGKRFVVVEDDALVTDAMRKTLELMGGEVKCFHSGEDALLHAHSWHADYYIVDYMLGGALSGIKFLDQLRQKLGRPIHAVLATGDTSPNSARTFEACHWPVLHKPVNIADLLVCLSGQVI